MSAAATSAAAEQVRGLVSWEAWQAVIPAYVTTRAVLFFIVFVSTLAIPLVPKFGLYAHASPDNPLLDGLVRWDSWSYIYIATRGYSLGDVGTGEIATVPFFPLYPLVLRTVAVFTGNVFVSGVVVANAALLVALIYLYRLARREFESETATRAVLYLAAAPGAIFFSAVYSESLFVALVAATFYYAGEGRWWRAAVLGALAASARNTGVLLAGVIALEGLFQRSLPPRPTAGSGSHASSSNVGDQTSRSAWQSLIAAAIVPSGLLAYMVYLANTFGDPLAFVHAHATLQRFVSLTAWLQLPRAIVESLRLGPSPLAGQVDPAILIDTVMTAAFIPLVGAVCWTMRPAYGFYTLLTFLIPGISSGTLFSMTRYTLMLVPAFMVLARWGRVAWVDRVVLGLSLPIMGYLAVTFSHNYPPV